MLGIRRRPGGALISDNELAILGPSGGRFLLDAAPARAPREVVPLGSARETCLLLSFFFLFFFGFALFFCLFLAHHVSPGM